MTQASRPRGYFWVLLAAALIAVCSQIGIASAHEIRPAYLQIDQIGESRFNVQWRTPLMSGARLPVVLQFSGAVTNVTEPVERRLPDSILERWIIEAPGLAGQRINFVGLQATITDVLVRVKLSGGDVTTTLVRPSKPWLEIDAVQSWWQVMQVFVGSGIEHILFGFDHLLFVASLMLIVRNLGMLIKTVTAFTVAHSITLTCATMGWFTLPPGPVEATIALSILLVGVEVVRMERGATSLTIEWPWMVAFLFGLLHGFGFAGALSSFGLPQGDVPLALLSFNIGVEIGQLMFIAVILAAVALTRRYFDVPKRAVIASAYVIGAIAAFWTIERIHSMLA